MFHKVIITAVIVFIISQIWGDEKVLGPANVIIKHVQQCPNPELYNYQIEVERKKLSRTQDAFSGTATLDKPMDEQMGIFVNINKYGDGGWKNIYVMDKDNACGYLMELSEENFKKVLEEIGAPPQCPLAAGAYSIEDFTVDYEDLPENLTYGSFEIDFFLTDATLANKRMSCVRSYVDITPKKEE